MEFPNERRASSGAQVPGYGIVYAGEEKLSCEIVDISPGGMTLRIPSRFEVGKLVTIAFSLPGAGTSAKRLEADGVVAQVWPLANRFGCAVEFAVIEGRVAAQIQAFIDGVAPEVDPADARAKRETETQARKSTARYKMLDEPPVDVGEGWQLSSRTPTVEQRAAPGRTASTPAQADADAAIAPADVRVEIPTGHVSAGSGAQNPASGREQERSPTLSQPIIEGGPETQRDELTDDAAGLGLGTSPGKAPDAVTLSRIEHGAPGFPGGPAAAPVTGEYEPPDTPGDEHPTASFARVGSDVKLIANGGASEDRFATAETTEMPAADGGELEAAPARRGLSGRPISGVSAAVAPGQSPRERTSSTEVSAQAQSVPISRRASQRTRASAPSALGPTTPPADMSQAPPQTPLPNPQAPLGSSVRSTPRPTTGAYRQGPARGRASRGRNAVEGLPVESAAAVPRTQPGVAQPGDDRSALPRSASGVADPGAVRAAPQTPRSARIQAAPGAPETPRPRRGVAGQGVAAGSGQSRESRDGRRHPSDVPVTSRPRQTLTDHALSDSPPSERPRQGSAQSTTPNPSRPSPPERSSDAFISRGRRTAKERSGIGPRPQTARTIPGGPSRSPKTPLDRQLMNLYREALTEVSRKDTAKKKTSAEKRPTGRPAKKQTRTKKR